jgi:cell division protein FtsI (penicillin-binding protein 3)
MKAALKKSIRRRTLVVGVVFSLGLAMIAARSVQVQVYKREKLARIAAGQYERSMVTVGKRGTIYDTNYRTLAVSIDVTSIGAHPQQLKDKKKVASALSQNLQMNRRLISQELGGQKSFVWVKRQASPREVKQVRALKLEGIAFVPERSRYYPNKALGAQVLGFTGVDGQGLEGLEFYYNNQLQGARDKVTVLKDARGYRFDDITTDHADYSGNNLILTIDGTIQYITEKALTEAVKEYSAKSGIAVVMAPKTGALLAMAHYPEFNPNAYGSHHRDTWRNRAVTDSFEPGSTMKMFLAAAALESGLCSANTIFFCENGSYRVGRNTIHDTKPHGWMSVQQIIKVSSNIGAAKIGARIGAQRLHRALKDFGFGDRTSIDCPGETSGRLADYRQWRKIDASAIAFGQGISASALQLVTATAAIANGGILMKPYLVQAVTDAQGRLIKKVDPFPVRRVVSAETARTVRRILHTVVTEGGTGENAAVEGYAVGGKTGTAQKVEPTGGYSTTRYIASFLGFLPIENPEAVILVAIDEPQKQHYGGTVAAPAFKQIAEKMMNYINKSPQDRKGRLIARAKGRPIS